MADQRRSFCNRAVSGRPRKDISGEAARDLGLKARLAGIYVHINGSDDLQYPFALTPPNLNAANE
jgi:hypothetical protein